MADEPIDQRPRRRLFGRRRAGSVETPRDRAPVVVTESNAPEVAAPPPRASDTVSGPSSAADGGDGEQQRNRDSGASDSVSAATVETAEPGVPDAVEAPEAIADQETPDEDPDAAGADDAPGASVDPALGVEVTDATEPDVEMGDGLAPGEASEDTPVVRDGTEGSGAVDADDATEAEVDDASGGRSRACHQPGR
jgi:hypothetical protein